MHQISSFETEGILISLDLPYFLELANQHALLVATFGLGMNHVLTGKFEGRIPLVTVPL